MLIIIVINSSIALLDTSSPVVGFEERGENLIPPLPVMAPCGALLKRHVTLQEDQRVLSVPAAGSHHEGTDILDRFLLLAKQLSAFRLLPSFRAFLPIGGHFVLDRFQESSDVRQQFDPPPVAGASGDS